MVNVPKYFNRDISWLSFNYRVLEEADDKRLPLYERLKFLAIYSSNLDEFYKVRVAEYKYNFDPEEVDEIQGASPVKVLKQINTIVDKQLIDFSRIFHNEILAGLYEEGLMLYQGFEPPAKVHQTFIRDYFYREVIPYLQPVLLTRGTRSFLRDNRLYLAIKLFRKKNTDDPERLKKRRPRYAIVKLPTNDLPRFIRLPDLGGQYHFLFLDDLVRFNLQELFPGYDVDSSYCIKLLRDADLGIQDEFSGNLVEKIRRNIGLRKVGEPTLFTYDRAIPSEFLQILKETFGLYKEDMLAGERYLSFQDFFSFPNPFSPRLQMNHPSPIQPAALRKYGSMFSAIKIKDRVLHYPYQSFDFVLKFLNEASLDPKVEEIKVTQYRVASNSAVVNALINAARNGKRVTVFVEVKARFDEENNLQMARLMEKAGVRIIYSLPGLKVHAKMALVIRRAGGVRKRSYAYLSTGNFNEKTARLYADHGFFTCKDEYIYDLERLFNYLEDQSELPVFNKILVTQFNFKQDLMRYIDREIELAQNGGEGYILLKMNGIQNKTFINKLYEASDAGVKIDLIVRGICSVVPDQPFSKNIRIRRIVDSYLEHARIWVFGNSGNKKVYMTSADWMNRNINRRIEIAFPVDDEEILEELLDILNLQLRDNVKARYIDHQLNNIKVEHDGYERIRSQWSTFNMLAAKEPDYNGDLFEV
ncbi:polyphosphate kinase 1 [Alkalitalea saponilacus]|uniref:Polyphosphate kinase n=1 Tax=Alkalitalea saponilacus TaxID=889453 RepID=A0A1T5GBZ6_9BACT|nr:polyphosphate kinase 1 [Alkalitalea saponilacus]ASB47923.1 polyphosphate kinase 1 [Alkalitalea saponilacus]SKC05889.1 polyphosphate kinase [Alkalitalea saponilacus]